jgi:hypothetical protein
MAKKLEFPAFDLIEYSRISEMRSVMQTSDEVSSKYNATAFCLFSAYISYQTLVDAAFRVET